MAHQTYNIYSLNVGMNNSLAGLVTLIESENLDIILLQEVRLTSVQIEKQIIGFNAVSNIDPHNVMQPGTALVWRRELPVEEVISVSTCRLQIAKLGSYRLFNCYAPSGSNKKSERAKFFSQDVFTTWFWILSCL